MENLQEKTVPAEIHELGGKKENFFIEVLKFAIIALLIVVPIRLFIAQPFVVSGASMDPTFNNGQYLIVDQLSYHLSKPERGDVIIFRFPNDPSKFFIKRIVALPNETVEIRDKKIFILNDSVPGGFELSEPYVAPENNVSGEIRVALGEDDYFVLGDNREASSDSRSWGSLSRELIVGRAFLRLLPLSEVDLLPGEYRIGASI